MKRLLTTLFALSTLLAAVATVSPAYAYISPYSRRYKEVTQLQQRHAPVRTTATVTQAAPAPVIPPENQVFASQEDQLVSAVEQAQPAVASVIITSQVPQIDQRMQRIPFGDGYIEVPQDVQSGTQDQVVGAGSAFFVRSDGLLMTNNHVVQDPNASYTVLTNDGRKLDATVVYQDAKNDVALLKVGGQNFPTLTFSPSDQVHLAQTAIAIGNALGEYDDTVSVGVISGLRRTVTAGGLEGGGTETLTALIQTDAAINEGNSGGPLLNSHGQVIGMNTAMASSAQNIGFAIPVSTLRQALDRYQG